jgi:hypothetical protein
MGVGVLPREPHEIDMVDGHARIARRELGARVGLGVSAGTIAFLVAYAILQLLHAADRDPPAVTAIAAIPLFARFLFSAVVAAVVGGPSALIPDDVERALRGVPRILAAAIAVFVTVDILFP